MALKRSFEDFLGRLLRGPRDGDLTDPQPSTTPMREVTRALPPQVAQAMPRPATSSTLREWISAEVRRGVPRWTLYRRLSKAAAQTTMSSEKTIMAIEIKAIEDLLIERNRRGKELERAGQIDQAMALYEANVTDRFNGSHAYERLRVLYKTRGDFANTIRVCDCYLRHVGTDDKIVQAYRAEIVNISPASQRRFQETRPA
jgi:hypothetical protein